MTRIETWRMRATEQPAAAGKRGGSAGLAQGPARNGRRASITDGGYVRVPSRSLPNLPHPAGRPAGLADAPAACVEWPARIPEFLIESNTHGHEIRT
jgi:hypothetical protein